MPWKPRSRHQEAEGFPLVCDKCGSDNVRLVSSKAEKGYNYDTYRCNNCSNEFIEYT